MDLIKENSKRRVEANPVFSKIDEYARYLKDVRDESVTSLNLKELEISEKKRENRSNEFDELSITNENLHVYNYPMDMDKIQIDSSLIASNDNEIKNIDRKSTRLNSSH